MSPDAICRIDRLTHVARALSQEAQTIQANLANAERRFQATFQHAPVGIAHVALDGSFLTVNPRFEEITGYPAAMLMRLGFQQITHPDDLDADVALLGRLHRGVLQRYTLEKRYIRADASLIWINLTVALVRDERDAPEFYVAVVEDLSEMRQAHFDAVHDPLTGLLNRRGFVVRARALLRQAAETHRGVSLIYLDLDGFKQLNDSRGHSAGDRCLVEVARLIEDMVATRHVVARMGGDEFVLLVDEEGTDLGEALRVGLMTLGGAHGGVSGSFGLVTLIPDDDTELDSIVARADEAMLAAKRAGKNQLVTTALL
ncbi:diguanylate cyclase [Sphingobium sp. BHU LFT2]|uniref:GGDEF domain-containing protein n=1 Tax=Sphingobium sp. BHU LFT2 TaxID=2807634 RepID=UPI001BEAB80E|nr:GGDEF domain-containing protein [Sphingobium sp. BHU LFT2]MBT2242273.1 diguanylate cyclase [Sphingobium sp. BHU LFT2]